MSLYPSSSRKIETPPVGITEFEILKASHRFLRDEDEKPSTWDEKLAEKYYSNLYREFAVCDLKHYKSGNFALRWRTEDEVLSGYGETTCGNTRCTRHFKADDNSPLTTLELPFAYAEHGETKSALVKVVLCSKCVKKLMWKRLQEKEKAQNGKGKEKEQGLEDGQETAEAERSTQEGERSVRDIKKEDDGQEKSDFTRHSDSEERRKKKRSRPHDEEGRFEENDSKRTRRHGHRSSRRESRSRSPQRPSHNRSHTERKEKSSHKTGRSSS
ncbi:Protein FRA10AC1-like protein [Psilocybe cubensis]|uniref:Protein FRA10AC1 n=2 Tax=Psilocybe cubensis TaxID=181762 RepID=A0A8H7XYX0_PSICU|nr:Protein FRA10AC1-like protein [Psilocybe cubensis]KAH9481718.1 Protein FRA10AC1-like protein [Psilocybe cubensis]